MKNEKMITKEKGMKKWKVDDKKKRMTDDKGKGDDKKESMGGFFKVKSWFIFFIMVIIAVFISIVIVDFELKEIKITKDVGTVSAATTTTDNVFGFAWSSNIGWISFNSTDCDSDCVWPTCTSDGITAGCPPFNTTYSDYAVRISTTTGQLSGHAWSSNIGWISFEENNVPDNDYDFRIAAKGNCPGCTSASGCTACLNRNNGKVFGWAKILALGDNGWVSLNSQNTGTAIAYAVTVSTTTPDAGDFKGWAWNGGDGGTGIGWISFNSSNPDAGGGAYKVATNISFWPTAINLTAPNWSRDMACNQGEGALRAQLRWNYHHPENKQCGAYQIILRDSGGAEVFDSGKFDNPADADEGINRVCIGKDNDDSTCFFNIDKNVYSGFDYDTAYQWEVILWDSDDMQSATFAYNSTLDTEIDFDDGDPYTFTTYKHEFPIVYFSWFPVNPSLGEETRFYSNDSIGSYYYDEFNRDTPQPCDDDNCIYKWEITSGEESSSILDPDPADSDASTSVMVFNQRNITNTVQLTITNQDPAPGEDNYYCSSSTDINIKKRLPTWIESK